jgi:hypothetical protein
MTLMEDFKRLEARVEKQDGTIEELRDRLIIAETEVRQVEGLRRAAYWVGGLIIAGSISFGFGVLSLVH